MVAQDCAQSDFDISKDGDYVDSLGNLFQHLTTLTVIFCSFCLSEIFCISHCAHCPVTGIPLKRSWLPLLDSPICYLYTSVRSPMSLLFSRLNSHSSLSLSSAVRCSSPFITCVVSPVCPCLSCTGEPSTGHSTPSVASPVPSRGEGSPPSTCWQRFA